MSMGSVFFFQAEDGIRDDLVTGVQTCALPILGVSNVEVIVEDGSRGYPQEAPYNGIAVHAATPEAPHSLLAELATDGRLVVPIATGSADLLVAFIRDRGNLRQETIGPCRFVPLIGVEGFRPPD